MREEEDVDSVHVGTTYPSGSLVRARRPHMWGEATPPKPEQFVNYTPPADGPVQPEPDTLSASAVLASKAAAEKQLLQEEITAFVNDMQARGFPGAQRIKVKTGYKKGLRYLLLPKYAKEEEGEVIGWLYHTSDYARALGKGPGGLSDEDYDLFLRSGSTRFGITAEGKLLEEYVWTNIWIPNLKVVGSINDVADSLVGNYRWYLAELAKRYK